VTDQPPPPFGRELALPAKPPQPYLERRPALIPLVVVAFLALVGAGNLPYDYYIFLRCALTTAGVFVVVHSIRSGWLGWLALGIPMVILWAPAVFIPLPASTWKVLDIIVAIVLVVAGLLLPSPARTDDGSPRWKWWAVALLVFGIGWLTSATTVYATDSGDTGCVQQYDNRGSWCD